MELELAADADAALRLSRLKALTACRIGRPRTQPLKIVWHDSPDHSLLTAGVALSEQRGVWRLEGMIPANATWLPAQPPPVLQETADRLALTDVPAPLAPVAAFEGRRTVTTHHLDAGDVTLTVDRGVLRAVTADRPVARIGLVGEEHAVRAAAMLIAAAEPVSVPLAALSAEGIALATGLPCTPRHDGPPVLPGADIGIADALAHILGHLTDVMLAHSVFAGGEDKRGMIAVHQMRVAVRRARSALSIFRPALPQGALDSVNDGLKALGARLGPTRDWDVFADETAPAIQDALPGDERFGRLVAAAARRRRDCRKGLAAYIASPEFRMLGIDLAWFAAAQSWRGERVVDQTPAPAEAAPVDVTTDGIVPDGAPAAVAPEQDPPSTETEIPALRDFAGAVLRLRWKKLLSSGKRIEDLDIPSLHGVRLRAKRVRYAAEMFATLHDRKASRRFIDRLSDLQQRLGVLNDGAVATHLLDELGGASGRHAYATGVVAGFMAARAGKIRPRIVDAFEKFKRQQAYWT